MQAVEAVFEADALDAGVAGGLDDGADDGVEAGRVAAAGEDADACRCGHALDYSKCVIARVATVRNGVLELVFVQMGG